MKFQPIIILQLEVWIAYEPSNPIRLELIFGFCRMKGLLSPGWDDPLLQSYPKHLTKTPELREAL